MSLRKSRVAGTIVAVLVAIAPAFLSQGGAQATVSASARTSVSRASTSSLALSDFATQIETLGVESYPDSFAGAEITNTGVTNVYSTKPFDQALVGAINTTNVSNYPIDFIDVPLSYSQLDTLNDQVTAAYSQLKSEGVSMYDSYPDPASGTVVVDTLTSSSATDIASILTATFGTEVTLGQKFASPMVALGRNNDYPPFYDGDYINNKTLNVNCTGGFNVLNNENKPFMLTSGHCGSGTYQTQHGEIGTTSTNWYKCNSTTWDVQVITEASGLGDVWTDDGNAGPVVGYRIPANNDSLTWNGYVSGEQRGPVTKVDATVDGIKDDVGNCTYNAVHQVVATGSLCQNGDSGGPVYQQYEGTPDVNAIGIISSGDEVNGKIVACSATLINSILIGKSLKLVTSSL